MTATFRRPSLEAFTVALTWACGALGVAAGIILAVDRSIEHDVIQLRPAVDFFGLVHLGLIPWGVALMATGVGTTILQHHRPSHARRCLLAQTIVAGFLMAVNLFEAAILAQHHGEQLGWLGAVLWAFPMIVGAITCVMMAAVTAER